METTVIVISILLIIAMIALFLLTLIKREKKDNENINEWSYKRYAEFYKQMELSDPRFKEKINKIINMILVDKETSVKKIAKDSGCTLEECILKINYLKNKRIIDDCYIDRDTNKIVRCSPKDLKLVEKYKPYIYGSHSSLEEIVAQVPTTTNDVEKKRNTVIKELKYLIDNKIVNGIAFNEVDEVLIYYTIEKHKHDKDYATIACDHCGALNEVNYDSKARCKYCGGIVEGKKCFDELKN